MSNITNLSNLSTRVRDDLKSIRTLVLGNGGSLASLPTANKTSILAALTELHVLVTALPSGGGGGGASINDAATGTASTWSSQKVQDTITAAITAIVTGAPAALDTLDELSAALGDDANFAATMTTALGNRVRIDAAQTLTGPQKTQVLANIGGAATLHTHAASDISDATSTGRSVLTAVDASTVRTLIGAGTSNLVLGTTGTTAAAGNHTQAASTISDSTTVGRAVLTAADAAAARTAIGAGTSSLAIGTTSSTAAAGDHGHTAANITDSTTVGRSVLTAATGAAARTAIGAGTSNLGLGTTSGTAYDAAVAIAALGGKSDTGHTHTAANISDSTAVGRSVLTAADAATARTAIGAGTSNLALGTTSSTASAGNHTHTITGVTGLQTALDGKVDSTDVDLLVITTEATKPATPAAKTIYFVLP